MRLACCQLDIAWEDKPANYRRVEALIGAAALPPGTLLLLPEMFATGFTMNAAAVAEPMDGPTASFLSDLARRHKIFVQAGMVVRGAGDAQPRNEALVFDPEGRPLARYAKMHLFSFAGEPMHYTAGESPVVFDWQEAVVAPAICYDLRFPELFRWAVKDRARDPFDHCLLAGAPRGALAGSVACPGNRESMLRSSGESLRARSVRTGLRRPQPDYRPARRSAGRRRSTGRRDPG